MKVHSRPTARRVVGALLFAVAAVLAADRASAQTTLADLVAGGVLPSQSMDLLFSEFALVAVTGQVDTDPANYAVVALANGFRIVPAEGGMDLASGQVGTLVLDYRVTGGPGIEIEGALLSFDAAATGSGSQASVVEDLYANAGMMDSLGSALVLVTGGGGLQTSDDLSFAGTLAGLYASSAISLVASEGGSASVNSVDQEFVTLPEPGAALLGLTALLSLGALKRLRAS